MPQDETPSGMSTADDESAVRATVDDSSLGGSQQIVDPGQLGLQGNGSQSSQQQAPTGLGPGYQMPVFQNTDEYSRAMQDPNGWTATSTFSMAPSGTYPYAPTYTTSGKDGAIPSNVIGKASSVIGQPYALGAAIGSGSWDCGSLVSWAFAQSGVKGVPRYVPTLLADGRFKDVGGLKNAQPGDLLFPTGGYGTYLGSHVAIYVGNGQIIEAPHPGAGVRIMPASEYTGYVVKRYAG
jgi:cell wall-associated NlpC family hydrolase